MTKNMKTYVGAALAAALAVLTLAVPARAVNTPDAVQNEADKSANSRYVRGGADVSKAANLYYVGSSSEAVVTITATAMTFYAPGNVLDTSVGTAGVITYASTLGSNTMGALCDYLNGIGSTITSYRCKLLDAKRDDPPVILKTQTQASGTNDLKAPGGFNVPITTNTIISLGINPAAGKRVVLRHCQTNNQDSGNGGSTGNNLYVYGQKRKYGNGMNLVDMGIACQSNGACSQGAAIVGALQNDTDEVFRSSTTQNTTAHVPALTSNIDGFMEFAPNAHVVVRAGNLSGTNAAQTENNHVACEWWEK
jgi:hypothetical protein